MKVVFWGTRGSLPAPLTAAAVRAKVAQAVSAAIIEGLADTARVEAFLDRLPFAVGGTFGGNTACVEVRTGAAEFVLCDAGTGLRDFGNTVFPARPKGQPGVYNIFLSHPHWDHIQGFPFFTPAYVPGAHIRILGCHEGLEAAFRGQQRTPWFPVDFAQLSAGIEFVRLAPGEPVELAGLRVTPFAQDHPGGSFGYRFEAQGKVFVYSTDSEHQDEALRPDHVYRDFVRGADLLVFDAQYVFSDAAYSRENWGHSSNIQGVELAVECGVKRLCLFHHDPARSDEELANYLQETVRYAELMAGEGGLAVLMAFDGLAVEL